MRQVHGSGRFSSRTGAHYKGVEMQSSQYSALDLRSRKAIAASASHVQVLAYTMYASSVVSIEALDAASLKNSRLSN